MMGLSALWCLSIIITQELLLPPEDAGFNVLRVALRDVDEEDIHKHFEAVIAFVQVCVHHPS